MSQQAFYFDGTRCTGCKTCEMSCKDFKDLPLGIAYRKVYEVTTGETTMNDRGAASTTCVSYPLSMSCNHCDTPACFASCPQAAIAKDADTGLVLIDEEKCIGCGACIEACPYNAPVLDEQTQKVGKCDGCYDRVVAGESPVCVEACPARALGFGDADTLEKEGVRAAIVPLPDPTATVPNFFIKASADALPFDTEGITVANPLEVV